MNTFLGFEPFDTFNTNLERLDRLRPRDNNIPGDQVDASDMSQYTPPSNKFVGSIRDRNDPDKAILEAYDVHQFLSDVDARIASRKVTQDADKIKEALLFISSDKGDAKTLVLSPEFANRTYAEFKELCILNWQKEEERDPYHNLIKYKNLKLGNGTSSDLLASLSNYGKRIKDDILSNANIPKHRNASGNKKDLVEIHHVIEYMSMGILYENSSDEFRRAFKEYDINPKEGLIKSFAEIKSLAAKKQIKFESETVLYVKNKGKKPPEAQKEKGTVQSYGQPINKGKPNNNQQQQQSCPPPKSQNSYQNYSNNQNFQKGQNSFRGFGRGRGYGRGFNSYQNQNPGQGQNPVVCFKCNQPGHRANTCRSCHYCHSHGHWIADCPAKYKDENSGKNTYSNDGNQQGQGK